MIFEPSRARVGAMLLIFGFVSIGSAETLEFGTFRAVTESGQLIEGSRGRLDESGLHATTRGGQVAVSREELRLLDVKSGSDAGKFGAVGAISGLLFAVVGIIEVESDPNTELRSERVLPFIVITSGVGALIGGLVGASRTKWSRVSLSTEIPPVEPGPLAISLEVRF
jgi:hypothetical protein